MNGESEEIRLSQAGFLSIVSADAARIGRVEEIDRLLHREMEVSPGRVVLAMILDALTGMSPLFGLANFFADKDVEQRLGENIPWKKRNDDTAGRVLDRISEVGTNLVMGGIAVQVVRSLSLDLSHAHQDVTSHKVYGDYQLYEEGHRSHHLQRSAHGGAQLWFPQGSRFRQCPLAQVAPADRGPRTRAGRCTHDLSADGTHDARES